MDNVVSFKSKAKKQTIGEVLNALIAENPDATRAIVTVFHEGDGSGMTTYYCCHAQEIAAAGARYIVLAGGEMLEDR